MIPIFSYGDAPGELGGRSRAANQQIRLEAELPDSRVLIGDTDTLRGHSRGGDDDLAAFGLTSVVIGDARVITHHAEGGDDQVWAGGLQGASAYGDAETLSGHARGGDDRVTASGGFGSVASGFGDAATMTDHAHGGNDTLTGFTEHGSTRLYGDAFTMIRFARGGDDVLGSTDASSDFLYGDADTMDDHALGGADTLTGQGSHAQNHLYGDARLLQGRAAGGDDLLVAGGRDGGGPEAYNWLYGDGEALLGRAQGGNDTLVGGANNPDQMWGDAVEVARTATTGADLFVFTSDNGHDEIMDFEPGRDRIELDGFGLGGFEHLASRFVSTPHGVLISFGPDDDILLSGLAVSQVSASDFLFG